MRGQEIYRTQVILILVSLASLFICGVHSLFFAQSGIQFCIDMFIIALSIVVIIFADNLARNITTRASRTTESEQTQTPSMIK